MVNKPGFYLRKFKDVEVPEVILTRFKKATTKAIKDVDEHMTKDGWDLNFDIIKDDIIGDTIAPMFEWYIWAAFLSKGYQLKFSQDSNKLMVTSKKKRTK